MGEQHLKNEGDRVGPADYEFDTILLTAHALIRDARRERDRNAESPNADTAEQSASGDESLERSNVTKGYGIGPHDRTADWNHF